MPDFQRLSEILLYVEDMNRMVSFYTEVLGFDIQEGKPEHGFVRLETGGSSLCLHEGREGDVGPYAPKLVFDVADLETAADHLRNHDVPLGDARSPAPGIRVIDASDPEGNRFSIEATDDSAR